jgi:hypothetical protein
MKEINPTLLKELTANYGKKGLKTLGNLLKESRRNRDVFLG